MADLDEKLKPCPHCGGCCAKIVPIRDGYRAHCTKCGAAGGAEFYGPGDKPSARERAITAWNRRAYLDATQDQAPGVVEAFDPFCRVLAIIDALPPGYLPADDTPLREALPGAWPSIGDLRSLVLLLPTLASLSKGGEGGAK